MPLYNILTGKQYDPHLSTPQRCTGRSTAQALETIAYAMRFYGKPTDIPYDHHSQFNASGREELRMDMLRRIKQLIDQLGLRGFTVSRCTMTVTYRVWEER